MMMRIVMSTLALAAGIAAATQAATNSGLAARIGLGSALLVSTTVVMAGAVVLWAVMGARTTFYPEGASWPLYIGGLCGFAIIVCMAVAFPRIGGARAMALMVLGQSIAAMTIDHLGLFGMPHEPVTPRRVAGALMVACGVALLRP